MTANPKDDKDFSHQGNVEHLYVEDPEQFDADLIQFIEFRAASAWVIRTVASHGDATVGPRLTKRAPDYYFR